MPDPAYRVARDVARRLLEQYELKPPFDVAKLAARFAVVLEDEIPTRADVIAVHAATPGAKPRIVLDSSLVHSDDRRRFALAHALGHVLLGWHPLGEPCDVSHAPQELPVAVHDLIEGEANAFARELLTPTSWIAGFNAFERPAELMRHVSERAGVPLMAAARAVTLQLDPGHVWMVADQWGHVLDSGRSPGTSVKVPSAGAEFDGRSYARHATERQRVDLEGCQLTVWHFNAAAAEQLPRDRTAREMARLIGDDLGLDAAAGSELVARVDGIAGWANEQLGTASMSGMAHLLGERARSLPELADAATHPRFGELLNAKATELVTKRIAR